MRGKLNSRLVLLAPAAIIFLIFGVLTTHGQAANDTSSGMMHPLTHLTRTPTPTRTPSPTPQPTSQSSQVFDLDEIFYITTGGGCLDCGVCTWEGIKDELPANARQPLVWTDSTMDGHRHLCVFGLPSNRDVVYDLYTPDGDRAVRFIDPARGGTSAFYGREEYFYMPLGLPYGTWTVVARSGGSTVRTTFTHPPREPTYIEVTHAQTGKVPHPLDPQWSMPHKQGDQVAIFGTGFRANSKITLVVTRDTGRYDSSGRMQLNTVIGWTVNTNSRGQFHLQFPIDRSFRDGNYVVLVNPTSGRALDEDKWIEPVGGSLKVYSPWRACRSGPLSNLHKGEVARLSAGLPNNVRSRPRVTGRQIGRIQEYQSMRILDGPRCNNGYTWWYVEVFDDGARNNGLKGWTAEGDRSSYWLVPIH